VIQPSTPQSVDLPASAAVAHPALLLSSLALPRHSANALDQGDRANLKDNVPEHHASDHPSSKGDRFFGGATLSQFDCFPRYPLKLSHIKAFRAYPSVLLHISWEDSTPVMIDKLELSPSRFRSSTSDHIVRVRSQPKPRHPSKSRQRSHSTPKSLSTQTLTTNFNLTGDRTTAQRSQNLTSLPQSFTPLTPQSLADAGTWSDRT
jgi:hypothetical protein